MKACSKCGGIGKCEKSCKPMPKVKKAQEKSDLLKRFNDFDLKK